MTPSITIRWLSRARNQDGTPCHVVCSEHGTLTTPHPVDFVLAQGKAQRHADHFHDGHAIIHFHDGHAIIHGRWTPTSHRGRYAGLCVACGHLTSGHELAEAAADIKGPYRCATCDCVIEQRAPFDWLSIAEYERWAATNPEHAPSTPGHAAQGTT